MSDTDKMAEKLRKKKKKNKAIKKSDFLSSGSTLLNLAMSGFYEGGFTKGKYHFLVGDSASGKTWLSMTCLAEAAINKAFDSYRFIYDNAEDGACMDIERFFGKGVAERLEPPAKDKDDPLYSETIEDFYYNVDDAIKDGRPFIYILDSMDAVSSKDEEGKFEEGKKASRAGKESKGSYGDGKAKKNSSHLRQVRRKLRKTGSILIIINQTRDNPGAGPFQSSKTRSGGHALKFYAHLEMWSAIKKTLYTTYKENKVEIGIDALVSIKKNRNTGQLHQIVIPIYHSIGIDDVGSCIDYLLEWGKWKQAAQTINAKDFDVKMTYEKLVKYIEDNELEDDLRDIVATTWQNVEAACAVQRKNRYE